jgi:hypothetical protein
VIGKRILSLHEEVCRCPKCKGTTVKADMCKTCLLRDAEIDAIRKRAKTRRAK